MVIYVLWPGWTVGASMWHQSSCTALSLSISTAKPDLWWLILLGHGSYLDLQHIHRISACKLMYMISPSLSEYSANESFWVHVYVPSIVYRLITAVCCSYLVNDLCLAILVWGSQSESMPAMAKSGKQAKWCVHRVEQARWGGEGVRPSKGFPAYWFWILVYTIFQW